MGLFGQVAGHALEVNWGIQPFKICLSSVLPLYPLTTISFSFPKQTRNPEKLLFST